MNDESGVLVEGFDREPFIRQPWHPPYYQRLCEQHGLDKAMDLWMWELTSRAATRSCPGIVEMAERLEPDHGIRIRQMSRRHLRRDLDLFAETYNEAWKDNWGFMPYTKADLDTYAHRPPARLRPQLVHDRREGRHGRDGRDRDHRSRHEPGAEEDERPAAARSAGGATCAGARSSTASASASSASSRSTSTPASPPGFYIEHFDMAERDTAEVGRDGLDPRDQRRR